MNNKNKNFLGALGGKIHDGPPSWALGGAMAGLPPPPLMDPPVGIITFHWCLT